MVKKCCVCGEVKNTTDNILYTCQGGGCDVLVHQACYGIVSPPTGLWFCRKCESQERAARVRCELCPQKEGALKRTDSGGWAHVVCALYIPEATFGNNERMEPIVTSKLPKERFSKPCYICEERGMETQAMHGACMSCHKSSCRLSFHVTCAQRERLLCEDEDSRDPRSILYCGYCSQHFKKKERQKYKQLRKGSVTGPPGPLASPLSDLSPTSQSLMIAPHPYTLSDTGHVIGSAIEGELGMADRALVAVRVKKEKMVVNDSLSQKRPLDASQLPPKKKRRRKVSSSNESNTSESLSYVSEPVVGAPPDHSKGEPPAEVNHDGLPLSPCTQVSSGNVVRQPSSSTSSEQSLSSRSQVPPRSLQDLLERQWEHTAQFILDKVGKQNNVGSMLAHLHTLQSENRSMQSKIMELASQREFYIAINTKLRNSITEQDSHLNGLRDETNQHVEATQGNTPRPRANKRSSNKQRSRQHVDTNRSTESTPQPVLSKESESAQRIGQSIVIPDENSTQKPGEASRKTLPKSTKRAFQAKVPQASENTDSAHEITRVTNSVQAPISFTPLPREGEGGTDNVR